MLLATNLHKNFVDVEGITKPSMLSLQSSGIFRSEFDTPKPDRFVTDGDTALGKEILNISLAEIEAIEEPDSIRNDIWRESMAFVCVHPQILTMTVS